MHPGLFCAKSNVKEDGRAMLVKHAFIFTLQNSSEWPLQCTSNCILLVSRKKTFSLDFRFANSRKHKALWKKAFILIANQHLTCIEGHSKFIHKLEVSFTFVPNELSQKFQMQTRRKFTCIILQNISHKNCLKSVHKEVFEKNHGSIKCFLERKVWQE